MLVRRSILIICVCLFVGIIAVLYLFPKTFTPDQKNVRGAALVPTVSGVKNSKTEDKRTNIPILMYHYIEVVEDPKDTIRKLLDVLPSTFALQVNTLADDGYAFLTMGEVATAMDSGLTLSPKSVVLTFDDGYRDFYTDVFPILKSHHIKATAYIISGVLEKPNYMTADQIKEIAASGFVEIAAHTVHHSNLKKLDTTDMQKEVMESKKELEILTGQKVVSFAYPYGAHDDRTIQAVTDAGFTSSVTASSPNISKQGRYTIGRIRPGARIGTALLQLIETERRFYTF